MATEKPLYVALPDDLRAWLEELKSSSGLNMRQVVEAIFTRARQEGWTVKPQARVGTDGPVRP